MKATSQETMFEHLGRTSPPLVANLDQALQPIFRLAMRYAAPTLRLSLALILFWIGLGKFLAPTPVVGLIHASIFRFLAKAAFVYLLGTLEVIAAVFLALGMGVRFVALLALALFGSTLSIFLTTPAVVYAPRGFPLLSLAGQFLLKDVALAAACIMLMALDVARHQAQEL